MGTHSSTLAWRIPWMEEPDRLQSMESLGVRHDWVTSFSLFTFMHWRRKWHPTPVFLPGESQGQGSLVGCRLWGWTWLKWLSSSSSIRYGTPLPYSCLGNPMDGEAWWAAVHGVTTSQTRLSHFTFTFHFHALEKEIATHSSVLAWRIPRTWEPGGLPSVGSHRVGHDWSDLAAAAAGYH